MGTALLKPKGPALRHSLTLVNVPGVPPRRQRLGHRLGEEGAHWMLRGKR